MEDDAELQDLVKRFETLKEFLRQEGFIERWESQRSEIEKRQHMEKTMQLNEDYDNSICEMQEYAYSRTCRAMEWFNKLRSYLETIEDSREHAYTFSIALHGIDYNACRLLEAYQQFCAIDSIYGRHAKFADLTPQDQERVLEMMP
jgi:hypothetical protein